MAIRQNYLISQGETFSLTLYMKDAAGDPVDLTGHIVTLQVRASDGDTVIGNYETVVDAEGAVTIKVEDEETVLWPLGNVKYALRQDQPNGDVKYWSYGNITVKEVF